MLYLVFLLRYNLRAKRMNPQGGGCQHGNGVCAVTRGPKARRTDKAGDKLRQSSPTDGRRNLLVRLQARRSEIEQAVCTRVKGIESATPTDDPFYWEGLHKATSAILDYGFATIERRDWSLPIPAAALSQARLAAQTGISLDTVLRRYLAGYTIFGDFLVEEAQQVEWLLVDCKGLMRALAAALDRLMASVTEEFARTTAEIAKSHTDRRTDQIRRLLRGELIDATDLAYELDAWHIGLIGIGIGATAIREATCSLDRRLLVVDDGEERVWAWLGGRHPLNAEELAHIHSFPWPKLGTLALGEPVYGLGGWQLTHRQALATSLVALRGHTQVVQYRNVALLSAILQNELLATSLRQIFLDPLRKESGKNTVLLSTLRAYFASGCNISSAAASLSVNRHTVTSRLHAIEERLGRPLNTCSLELQAALRLEELG
jgi:PucR C-terminal helix-turn-helix domain